MKVTCIFTNRAVKFETITIASHKNALCNMPNKNDSGSYFLVIANISFTHDTTLF